MGRRADATELQDFLASLNGTDVPADRSRLLQSVWHGLKGDWQQAHEIAQDETGADAAWVHAWLHRIEGDATNAHYWYRCAKREPFTRDTAAEGEALAAVLLTR